MLATGLIAAGFLASWAAGQSPGAESKRPARTPLALRQAVDAALEREPRATTVVQQAAVVRELAALANELAEHPTMAPSAVGSLRGRIKARLERMHSALAVKPAQKVPPRSIENAILAQVGAGGDPPKRDQQGPPQLTIDTGEELAQLIRETIAPETWVENGGNGVIVYYPSLHALVVRQTGEAHERLGDLIGQLHP